MDEDLKTYIERRERALARVRQILIRDLKVRRRPEELDPDTPLFGAGLGLDSIDAVELVVCFEAELGVRLSDPSSAPRALRTINTLVDLALEAGRVGATGEEAHERRDQ